MKKLYRSKTNRKISGVCAGIANYFNVDPTVVRVAWIILSVLTAFMVGVIIYVLCAFIIPEEPDAFETQGRYVDNDKQ